MSFSASTKYRNFGIRYITVYLKIWADVGTTMGDKFVPWKGYQSNFIFTLVLPDGRCDGVFETNKYVVIYNKKY